MYAIHFTHNEQQNIPLNYLIFSWSCVDGSSWSWCGVDGSSWSWCGVGGSSWSWCSVGGSSRSWCGVGGGLINWGNVSRSFVGRCGVSGCLIGWGGVGFVLLLLDVFGVLRFSFVFHISNVSIAVGLVGDDLGATVGEGNTVRAGDYLAVAALRVGVVVV